MHGNVSEWVWDYYGAYPAEEQTDPTGPETGSLRVYRGGGWNDFAKNMRSAYRATLEPELASFNIGIRLVRNAVAGSGTVSGGAIENAAGGDGTVLIAYFSWGGNTQGIAEEIQRQTGADLFEITLVNPYSDDYNTVLDEAQRDQNEQARPELASHVENMEQYDTILLGYPNWWYGVPMALLSFLENNDLSGKQVYLFCSHGTGGLAQSVEIIREAAPDAEISDNIFDCYEEDAPVSEEAITEWLTTLGNGAESDGNF